MHKIGIISDTHGWLRSEVLEILRDCEVILHGGDLDTKEIMNELGQIAPVYAVRGNNDYWVSDLPETLSMELYGLRFFMVHDKNEIPEDASIYDIIIYGHSHKYEEIYSGRQLILNPGSCGPKRFTLPVTMALLKMEDDGTYQVERIELEETTAGKRERKGSRTFFRRKKQPPDMKRMIELVIRDTEKGIAVDKIADMHGISRKLAEQICRLYLTHPGVGTEGIMRKMGL